MIKPAGIRYTLASIPGSTKRVKLGVTASLAQHIATGRRTQLYQDQMNYVCEDSFYTQQIATDISNKSFF
jgi:hypothetical protein